MFHTRMCSVRYTASVVGDSGVLESGARELPLGKPRRWMGVLLCGPELLTACSPPSAPDLRLFMAYAPLALYAVYEDTLIEMQRHGANHGEDHIAHQSPPLPAPCHPGGPSHPPGG